MGLRLALLMLGCVARAASLQPQIDAALPGATITVPAGTYEGAIVINKPLTVIGEGLPTIQGNGKGKVVHIAAENVTLRGFRIRGSGLALFDDDSAIHVTANRATIDDNQIEDSLHGIYLKKANDCRVLNNRIIGKTTIAQESGPIEKGSASAPRIATRPRSSPIAAVMASTCGIASAPRSSATTSPRRATAFTSHSRTTRTANATRSIMSATACTTCIRTTTFSPRTRFPTTPPARR
jgi:parallel beta-helix repeat protein